MATGSISIERNMPVAEQVDYFHCRKENDCKLKHVMNWLSLFVDMYNRGIMEKIVK